MTATELLKIAIQFIEKEKTEVEKLRLKFELDSPGQLQKWQQKTLERDQTRIMLMDGLIQTVQMFELESDSSEQLAEELRAIEAQLKASGGMDIRDYTLAQIQLVVKELHLIIKDVPKNFTALSIFVKVMVINNLICECREKVFKENGVKYEVRYD